jgi:hypothetical protein
MGSDLRATSEGRPQRIHAMRLLRIAFAGALTLVALLTWLAVDPSALRRHGVAGSIEASHDGSSELTNARELERGAAARTARQSARVVGRQLLVARSRATDGNGETTLTSPLGSSTAELFGTVAASARVRLHWLAQRHAPYDDPSPFDATAPPVASRRNG